MLPLRLEPHVLDLAFYLVGLVDEILLLLGERLGAVVAVVERFEALFLAPYLLLELADEIVLDAEQVLELLDLDVFFEVLVFDLLLFGFEGMVVGGEEGELQFQFLDDGLLVAVGVGVRIFEGEGHEWDMCYI